MSEFISQKLKLGPVLPTLFCMFRSELQKYFWENWIFIEILTLLCEVGDWIFSVEGRFIKNKQK